MIFYLDDGTVGGEREGGSGFVGNKGSDRLGQLSAKPYEN